MNRFFIPCVLLLSRDAATAHEAREAARRAGLTVSLHRVDRREDFLVELLAGSTDLILMAGPGLTDFGTAEVLDTIERSGRTLPVLAVQERSASAIEGVTAFESRSGLVQVTDREHLPEALERILREQQGIRSRARIELDQAADMLRENQKLSTIGRLAASIAHEINNPLEAVTNLLYLMGLDDRLPEGTRHYLELAQREMDRVVRISKQTLNFYRETNAPVRVRISELLSEVLVLYTRRIAEKNLRVFEEYESSETVMVYPGEIRQVLSNLVTNAIEACAPNGRLRLRVTSTRKWSDSGVRGIRVSIGDNGGGISAEVRARLGEPFFTTKGQHGTGLGLWVTQSIVSRYGGEMQVRSTTAPQHHGTVFSIFLPTNMRPRAVENENGLGGGPDAGSASSSGNPTGRTWNRSRMRFSGN
ncbi:sensor histidine kinase [Paracidobacterium acidisoli]|nr:HAMP domain-containing sensor histidine kinase [Paracidobacterium acidisoli]